MFYGYYTSYNGQKNFVTTSQENLLFTPQVLYRGDTFRYVRAYQIETPSQRKAFDAFCEKQGCETEVKL